MTINYKDNPLLKIRVVTTINGEKEYRRNCIMVNDKFYIKNKDCFEINEKWRTVKSGYILFDHEKQEWVLTKSTPLINGVVDIENGEFVIGHFSKNLRNNCQIGNRYGNKYTCRSLDIALNNGFREHMSSGIFYSPKEVGDMDFNKISNQGQVYTNKGYNIEDNVDEFLTKKKLFAEYQPEVSKDCIIYSKFLGDISAGFEYETSSGILPDYIQYKHGIVACRDGSITSAEYVSVPMTGPKLLHNVHQICKELTKRCLIDINCSLHIHIGTIPTDRLFLVSLYTLAYKIQDQIFEMFPYYKTKPDGIKKKNYCKKLSNMGFHPLKDESKEGFEEYVNELYKRIFHFLSDGMDPDAFNNKKVTRHPIEQKWLRSSR